MKKIASFLLTCCAIFLICTTVFYNANANNICVSDHRSYKDTTLPACIQKLNRPASKAIRTSNGAMRYKHSITLKNGKILYAFSADPSIGCYINDPASVKYYNDSCRQVAMFPNVFKLKTGKRPFIAKGYSPDDFPEAAMGDYPAYFAGVKAKKP